MNKWIAISLGTVVGLSHIGMIGMISRQQKFPVVNLPVGPYTSYSIRAGKDGYAINYRANDPKVMHVERDIKKKGGFLGLGNNTVKVKEQYTMDGSFHVENRPMGKSLSGKEVACIEAIGSGKGTGKMVGASVGAAVAPSVTGIPFVGWVIAGAATMMGMDAGSDVGGSMAESLSGACQEE